MKLEKILDNLNSFEKNSFLKILDTIISAKPKNQKEIEKILSTKDKELKNVDNIIISKVFTLVEEEFFECIRNEFLDTSSHLDILIDIIIRDGNSIMRQEWFSRLYENELKKISKKIKDFQLEIENSVANNDPRARDYRIYKSCLNTAYSNDRDNNQENKITKDELSILLMLSKELELSQEEIKLINYLIIPIQKQDITTVINDLKNMGVVFFSRKHNNVYVADEVVRVLRKVRGKEVADKYFRRILRTLKEPQINLICRKHNIDWKLPLDDKVKLIINEGISFTGILKEDIFKDNINLTDRKNFINNLWEKGLKVNKPLKGILIEDKIQSIIDYFDDLEKDDKVGISIDGYDKVLKELSEVLKQLNSLVKIEFELQDENVLNSHYLLDYNIKPRDILDILNEKHLEEFCKIKNIKTRGDIYLNILDCYKDVENLYLENYHLIACRDYNNLKENGIAIKESDIGIKFESLTKKIFENLGFNVDEKLRKSLNTNKDKIDIVLNLGNNQLILVECKSVKESGYNKFSSVSRQLKSYSELAKKNNYQVIKSLLVAPDFSDDFVNECGIEYELNLSLITAVSLLNILNTFKTSKHKEFPYKLLMRDVLIKEDLIMKAMAK